VNTIRSDTVATTGRTKSKTATRITLTILLLYSFFPNKTLIYYGSVFFSLLSLFWKNKGRPMRSSIYLCVSSNNLWITEQIFVKTWYTYHATWAHIIGVHRKSPSSVIPILQLLRFLRKTFILLERLCRSSWKLVCVSCHMTPSQVILHISLPSVIPTLQPHMTPSQVVIYTSLPSVIPTLQAHMTPSEGIVHTSPSSLIPTVQPFKLLR
jgi:hypothetical protein